MKKVVFSGCSFTAGTGWDPSVDECRKFKNLWVNLCANNIDSLKSLELVNVGQASASNTIIFENTVDEISKHGSAIDTMFCQWTAMPRYRFSLGLERWSTVVRTEPTRKGNQDIHLSDGTKFTKEYLDKFFNQFNALHHLHPEILKVVRYTNILKRLAAAFDIKIYFINGICPWDNNYFVKLSGPNILPENYTHFTKTLILDIKNRDDADILELYNTIHNDYECEGGIDPNDWINLYGSMNQSKIDTNPDNLHPGIQSNQLYYQQISNFLKTH